MIHSDLNLSKICNKSMAALEILYTVGFAQDGKGERLQFNVKNINLVNEANKLLTLIKMGKKIPCNCRMYSLKYVVFFDFLFFPLKCRLFFWFFL